MHLSTVPREARSQGAGEEGGVCSLAAGVTGNCELSPLGEQQYTLLTAEFFSSP